MLALNALQVRIEPDTAVCQGRLPIHVGRAKAEVGWGASAGQNVLGVSHFLPYRHVDATEGIDDVLEASEVDGHVAVNVDAEVALHSGYSPLDPLLPSSLHHAHREGSVNAVLDIATSAIGDIHYQVPREAQDGRLVVQHIHSQDEDGIAAGGHVSWLVHVAV